MLKAEIKAELSQYKNVLELVRAANVLKEQGESEIMVNRCVAELRKEMLNSHDAIKKLQRRHIHETKLDTFGIIPIDASNLAAPVVVYDGTNMLI